MKTLLISVAVGVFVWPLVARDWTNASGKTIQADLVEVKGTTGAEVVVLKTTDGKTYDVPLAQLSAADQAYARDAAVKPPGEFKAEAAKPSIFKEMLDGKLVAVDGKRVGKYEMASDPDYYAFYFSAHWCGPCRAFTPSLVDFYNSNEGRKTKFEVIFVSNDHDDNAMEDYMKEAKMPWPAISFRQGARMKDVRKYAGSGIPCLVVVDREGKVVSDSYEGEKYVGPGKVMSDLAAKVAK